jgi:hypothetical protein
MAYYADWDREQHLTAFGKRLNDGQVRIERYGITISDEDKLNFTSSKCMPQITSTKRR